MGSLLTISRGIDVFSAFVGKIAAVLVLVCCLVSAGNAMIRYLFDYSSNGWLEIQWYMFAFIVLLGASHALRKNEHVRVDILYNAVSERGRLIIDAIGLVLLLIPSCFLLAWLCWPVFVQSYVQGEMSSNAGGLIRWPAKLMIAAGFALLVLQGISELIKRIAALSGAIRLETAYEKPLQ
jgi:TRAP-type mannitol/chloroaromatic compound transport system permease small subunit